ncbi:hypothetical protein BLX87_18795 [Bacillus sp. VT-16-64]|nr:hypothetical protein BLX87_18795 [Bacillus sp. VT-16-64]
MIVGRPIIFYQKTPLNTSVFKSCKKLLFLFLKNHIKFVMAASFFSVCKTNAIDQYNRKRKKLFAAIARRPALGLGASPYIQKEWNPKGYLSKS